MTDFLVECSSRVYRPGIINALMTATTAKFHQDMDDMYEDDDEEEDYAQLTLTRSPSHSSSSSSPVTSPVSPPPELEHDSDYSSEDESMPPSPPSTALPSFEGDNEKQKTQPQQQTQIAATEFYDQGFYLPARNPARLVSAVSVY